MEGIHFRRRREKLSQRAEQVANFCLLVALRGNLLPQAVSKKKGGDLDYKMESVNKRHF